MKTLIRVAAVLSAMLLCYPLAYAQTGTQTGGLRPNGRFDASSASSTAPYKSGLLADRPSTCVALKDFYNQTDGVKGIYRCNASGDGWDRLVGIGEAAEVNAVNDFVAINDCSVDTTAQLQAALDAIHDNIASLSRPTKLSIPPGTYCYGANGESLTVSSGPAFQLGSPEISIAGAGRGITTLKYTGPFGGGGIIVGKVCDIPTGSPVTMVNGILTVPCVNTPPFRIGDSATISGITAPASGALSGSIFINAAGSGYSDGDVLTVSCGTTNATFYYTLPFGAPTAILRTPGAGCTSGTNVATTGGAGTGATVNTAIATINANYTVSTVAARSWTADVGSGFTLQVNTSAATFDSVTVLVTPVSGLFGFAGGRKWIPVALTNCTDASMNVSPESNSNPTGAAIGGSNIARDSAGYVLPLGSPRNNAVCTMTASASVPDDSEVGLLWPSSALTRLGLLSGTYARATGDSTGHVNISHLSLTSQDNRAHQAGTLMQVRAVTNGVDIDDVEFANGFNGIYLDDNTLFAHITNSWFMNIWRDCVFEISANASKVVGSEFNGCGRSGFVGINNGNGGDFEISGETDFEDPIQTVSNTPITSITVLSDRARIVFSSDPVDRPNEGVGSARWLPGYNAVFYGVTDDTYNNGLGGSHSTCIIDVIHTQRDIECPFIHADGSTSGGVAVQINAYSIYAGNVLMLNNVRFEDDAGSGQGQTFSSIQLAGMLNMLGGWMCNAGCSNDFVIRTFLPPAPSNTSAVHLESVTFAGVNGKAVVGPLGNNCQECLATNLYNVDPLKIFDPTNLGGGDSSIIRSFGRVVETGTVTVGPNYGTAPPNFGGNTTDCQLRRVNTAFLCEGNEYAADADGKPTYAGPWPANTFVNNKVVSAGKPIKYYTVSGGTSPTWVSIGTQ